MLGLIETDAVDLSYFKGRTDTRVRVGVAIANPGRIGEKLHISPQELVDGQQIV